MSTVWATNFNKDTNPFTANLHLHQLCRTDRMIERERQEEKEPEVTSTWLIVAAQSLPLAQSDSTSRQIFVMGLSRMLVFVFIRTLRMRPFLSGTVSVIFPIIHEFLGAQSSTRRTTSPSVKFQEAVVQRWRSWS